MVSDTPETARERPTENVVVSLDCHLILKLAEMKEGVGGSRVVVEGGITNFLVKWSVVISSDSGESEGLSLLYSIFFENCWPVWLSRFRTRSTISSMQGNFGVRGRFESSECSSSLRVSDRSRFELLVDCTDSLLCSCDRGIRALSTVYVKTATSAV